MLSVSTIADKYAQYATIKNYNDRNNFNLTEWSQLQTASKDILLSVSLPLFSCPPCPEYLPPRALIRLRLCHYISHVLLTCLLTYLKIITLLCIPLTSHILQINQRKYICEMQ